MLKTEGFGVYYAAVTLTSYHNRTKIYAPQGAEITVLEKTCETAWRCEYKGNQFFCAPEKLSEVKPKIEIVKGKRK